jgi:hypothetical protein
MRYQGPACSGLERYGVNMRIDLRYDTFTYIVVVSHIHVSND